MVIKLAASSLLNTKVEVLQSASEEICTTATHFESIHSQAVSSRRFKISFSLVCRLLFWEGLPASSSWVARTPQSCPWSGLGEVG